ncbi:hypothetical protein KBC79_01750 [Candidatus Woesebacteria bacterium]|nr:hypothetical protein [Candidatus Woesebacteria bacterium]
MRKLYWYLSAYAKKHGIVFLLSVLGAVAIFSALLPTLITNLEKQNRSYIGIVGEYTLDNLPRQVTDQLSAGLTQIQADGSVAPLLAERWTIENEGKTYRFVLKQNLFWQDGEPLKPEDIQYQFNDVETIITPNDIVFKLPDAYAPFPTIVAEPILKNSLVKHWFFFTRPTKYGISNYTISDYSLQGQQLKELVVDGPDERFIYRFYLTEEDAVVAFQHGAVDILPDLQKRHDIFSWPTVTVTPTVHTNRYLAIFFNIRSPLFQKNTRQALSYALDKDSSELRALGPINPNSWAYLDSIKSYDKDNERALERLLDTLPPEPLSFELTTTSLFEKEAENIKKQWEAFGVEAVTACEASSEVENKADCDKLKISVRVRISNFPDLSSFQVLLVGQESPPDPDQYALWHSEQSTNFTGYKNTRIDNLLEKGRQTFDQQERTEIYQEFQQFFMEDAPAIFLKYLETYEVKRH